MATLRIHLIFLMIVLVQFSVSSQITTTYTLPQNYIGVISETDYNEAISISLEYFAKNNIQAKVMENEIVAFYEDGPKHFYLDNLVKNLSKMDASLYRKHIYEHFYGLLHDESSNPTFNQIKSLLGVIIKSNEAQPEINGDVIYHTFIPNTYTYLVIRENGLLRYVHHTSVDEWGIGPEELFNIAIQNGQKEHFSIGNEVIDHEHNVTVFEGSSQTISTIYSLESIAPQSIGKFGSIVCIPTNTIVFICPINSASTFNVLPTLMSSVKDVYETEPKAINQNFYWFYEGKYEIFSLSLVDQKLTIKLPVKLKALLK